MTDYGPKLRQARAEYDAAEAATADAREAYLEAADRQETAEEAQRIVQALAEAVQQRVHQRVEAVVTRCLSGVFDQPYEFRLRFERKRGRTEARLTFVRDGLEVDPLRAAGGGVVDLAAFALRLACLCLSRPPLRRVLILDEPFRFISQQYREAARLLVEALADEMGVQFIVVTHIDELRAGKVVEIGN